MVEPKASDETHRPPKHFALHGKDKPRVESHYCTPSELIRHSTISFLHENYFIEWELPFKGSKIMRFKLLKRFIPILWG